MIKVVIIGYGYWGPNLLRNFSKQSNCKVVGIIDARLERLEKVKEVDSSIVCYVSVDELKDELEVDAIVIATNVSSHYNLAKRFLLKGKHVLVEKPLTFSVEESRELIDLANKNNLILMVDHTFLYTSAVRKMKSFVRSNDLGKLKFYDSTRINLGLFQSDINVLWDLAPHDISILLYLTERMPMKVSASGISHTNNGIENIAYMTLKYDDDFIAHISCSWSSPVKIRSTILGGDKKMIVYNDLEPSDKIRVHDTSYNHSNLNDGILVEYRVGDVSLPKLENYEALDLMAKDFIGSIKENKQPVSSAKIGFDVVRILESASKSMKQKGLEVEII
jgi:predicted dehydrogenase